MGLELWQAGVLLVIVVAALALVVFAALRWQHARDRARRPVVNWLALPAALDESCRALCAQVAPHALLDSRGTAPQALATLRWRLVAEVPRGASAYGVYRIVSRRIDRSARVGVWVAAVRFAQRDNAAVTGTLLVASVDETWLFRPDARGQLDTTYFALRDDLRRRFPVGANFTFDREFQP